LLTNTNFDYNYKLHSKHAIIKYIQNEKNHGHLSIIAKSKIGKPIMIICHNPNFRLTTKARACKVASQEGSPGVTPHAPKSVGKREGMNPHTSKGASTLGVGASVDFQIIQKVISRVKTQWIEKFLISLERPWNLNV